MKIGFIGLTLEETPTVVTSSGVAGLRFLDEITTVNNLVPELKKQGVSAIVVLLHQGGRTAATVVNDKTCPGLNGDIVGIVDKLDPAVDVVISGHTHQEYVCTRNGKLLTQTGSYGRIATKVDLTIDPVTRTVLKKDANNIVAVNDVGILSGGTLPDGVVPLAKDSEIDAFVQNYEKLAAPMAGEVVGKISEPLDTTRSPAGESTLGDVIADAYLFGTSDASFDKPAQIAFTNSGGLRSDLKELDVTLGELYNVLPFSNSVVLMDLTGIQLLRLLEQQWEKPQYSGNGRVLQVSDGFTYTWAKSKPAGAAPGEGERVVTGSMKLNGAPIEMDKIYRVAVNDYLAAGGSNFTVLLEGANLQQGGIDLDIATAYFKAKGIVAKPALNRIKSVK
ncbi:5'-nucleotidase C-terminal domain-containing protein [Paraburkholderia sp.]|uniref:bifunctional metallophosphatase/5'-nucleotidase n=1 Tax=Paraburkholderia sp. TaxID=1926495 RepID=UPI0025FD058E|nr:5'-nucleotidase C-terminal domain-containing protein [Paraburkholderia sp.]